MSQKVHRWIWDPVCRFLAKQIIRDTRLFYSHYATAWLPSLRGALKIWRLHISWLRLASHRGVGGGSSPKLSKDLLQIGVAIRYPLASTNVVRVSSSSLCARPKSTSANAIVTLSERIGSPHSIRTVEVNLYMHYKDYGMWNNVANMEATLTAAGAPCFVWLAHLTKTVRNVNLTAPHSTISVSWICLYWWAPTSALPWQIVRHWQLSLVLWPKTPRHGTTVTHKPCHLYSLWQCVL